MSVAKQVQKRAPESPAGYELEGQALSAVKDWAGAASAFRQALSKKESSLLAMKVHESLDRAGRADEAHDFATGWMAKQPGNARFREYLAEDALQKRDLQRAQSHYQEIIQLEPNNARALNNLAYVLGKLNDPQGIALGERALALSPRNAKVMDTLGILLVNHGDAARGVQLLREAAKIAPQSLSIRLNLARGLVKTGDKGAARTELDSVVKDGQGKQIAKASARVVADPVSC